MYVGLSCGHSSYYFETYVLFEWYTVRLVFKNEHCKYTWLDGIELCAQITKHHFMKAQHNMIL